MGQKYVIAVLALSLLVAAPAHAGTVSRDGATVRFVGTPGQDEWPGPFLGWGDAITFSDGSAPIVAGAGCTQMGTLVQCPVTGVERVVLELGDGEDRPNIPTNFPLAVRIDGGPGDDVLTAGGTTSELNGGEGDDWFVSYSHSGEGDATLSGGPGTDWALYNQRFEPLNLSLDDVANDGAAGEHDNIRTDVEKVTGGYKDDVLTGSPGDDHLSGGEGRDDVYGLGGDDIVEGWLGGYGDRLYGGADDDTLVLAGRVHAEGGPGDDVFVPGLSSCGSCVASGGTGVDTVDFSGSSLGGVRISLDDVDDDGWAGTDDFRSDIENLVGGDDGMVLIGNDRPNVITGGAGDDVLDGRGGSDRLTGGDGVDLADYSSHTAPVRLTLDGVINDGVPGEHDLISTDVEDLRGGSGDDVLVGNLADNVLDGGAGADSLSGGGGLDAVDYSLREAPVRATLDGSASSGEPGERDTVSTDVEGAFGGFASDRLVGNGAGGFLIGLEGDDVLLDGGGEDLLDGGDGADQIDGTDGAVDEVVCGEGADRLWRDTRDAADSDCEYVTGGPRPLDPEATPTATPTPIPTPTPGPDQRFSLPRVTPRPIDRIVPALSVLRAATRARVTTVRRRGLTITVRCNELCRASAELTRRGGVVARGARPGLSGQERGLRLSLTAAGKRTLRAGSYRLTLTLTDRAGNVQRVVRTLRLT